MTDAAGGQVSERHPLGAPCKYCGSIDTWVEMRLEARRIGDFSLSGHQVKFSAGEWPYAVCGGCGHKSRGEDASR